VPKGPLGLVQGKKNKLPHSVPKGPLGLVQGKKINYRTLCQRAKGKKINYRTLCRLWAREKNKLPHSVPTLGKGKK
jgi:hypothetical protein